MARYIGPSYVVEFLMNPHVYDCVKLDNIFEISRTFYNLMLKETLKRYELLKQDKRYQKNKRCIRGISKKMNVLQLKIEKEKNKKQLKELKEQLKRKEKERKALYQTEKDLMFEFGYNEYILHEVAAEFKRYYQRIDINTAQKLATRAFKAVEKVRKGIAKHVYFKKFGTMTSIEGKTNKSGIILRYEKKQYIMKFMGMMVPVVVTKKDNYAHQALSDFSKISYCKIVRKVIRGKVKYYLQVTFKGVPPLKKNRKLGKGIVGVDPSLQMMAIMSDYRALLVELAPTVQQIQNEIRKLQRKLQRSRYAMNPNKFHPDGTINQKNKDSWIRSNEYMKTLFQLKELHRKQSAIRKLSHNRLTNVVLRLGHIFKVEKNSFRAFQKRKKKTVIKKKKFQSKKRFGKSIASKAPSAFLTMLKQKVEQLGGTFMYINPRKVKPSQYDHQTKEFRKKKLSERWHVFDDGTKVQRDLYSSFLITCADEQTNQIVQEDCEKNYQHFKKLHDIEIERIKKMPRKLSSFGIS